MAAEAAPAAQAGGSSASTSRGAGSADGAAKPSRTRTEMIQKLALYLKKKPDIVPSIKKRVENNQPLKVGEDVCDVGVLKDALAAYSRSCEAANAAPQAGSSSMGARWNPQGPSAATMHAKARLECEDAEQWHQKVQVIGGNKLAILTRPDVLTQPSNRYLANEEVVEVVARTVATKDGRTYLRLKLQDGWICTRSRKDFTKQVLKLCSNTDDVDLEPIGSEPPESLAKQLLEPVDDAGHRANLPEDEENRGGARPTVRPPQEFRVLATQCPILTSPHTMSASRSSLPQKEVFLADGAHFNAAEFRAYLHLKDGRGWVAEYKKADFRRLAVAPSSYSDMQLEAAVSRRRLQVTRTRRMVTSHSVVLPSSLPPEPSVMPKQVREKIPSLAEGPCIFPSDKELWPEELRPPKPLGAKTRAKLRTVYEKYAASIQQREVSGREASEKADGYARSSAKTKALRDAAKTAEKEVSALRSSWMDEVKVVLIEDDVDYHDKSAAETAAADKQMQLSVLPVQVNGRRYFCALLDEGNLEEADGESSTQKRLLGPFREREAQAREDLDTVRTQSKRQRCE